MQIVITGVLKRLKPLCVSYIIYRTANSSHWSVGNWKDKRYVQKEKMTNMFFSDEAYYRPLLCQIYSN